MMSRTIAFMTVPAVLLLSLTFLTGSLAGDSTSITMEEIRPVPPMAKKRKERCVKVLKKRRYGKWLAKKYRTKEGHPGILVKNKCDKPVACTVEIGGYSQKRDHDVSKKVKCGRAPGAEFECGAPKIGGDEGGSCGHYNLRCEHP
jgi:hypothetical protein